VAQDVNSSAKDPANFPSRFFEKLQKSSAEMEERLMTRSAKALKKLGRQEARLKQKLAKKDSLAAEQVFGNVEEKYRNMQAQLEKPEKLAGSARQYMPHLDSLKTSLRFLQVNPNLLPGGAVQLDKLKGALGRVSSLEGKLNQAENIKQYLRERREQLRDQLSRFGFAKELNRFSKEAYYYSQQLNDYKEMLNDPKKLKQTALSQVRKIPAFQQFFKEHSQLTSLFRLPDNYGSPESLQGLQTRAGVQDLIQQQLSAGGPNAQAMLQQNIQQARTQLNQLKDKINRFGNMAGDADDAMPNFKPNNQKTKTFFQRLEYGTNIQSTRSNPFFPTTTDLGLSIGYKITDNSTVGIGASYKAGWGKDISNINITSEGVGFRSFADVKLKGSFFASGGFEYNYQPPFSSIQDNNNLDNWQQSGLVGVSKIVSLRSKTFKKTKLQLLWDFLSYRQAPQTQAIKFRVGYSF
jgi:hypothetical protein